MLIWTVDSPAQLSSLSSCIIVFYFKPPIPSELPALEPPSSFSPLCTYIHTYNEYIFIVCMLSIVFLNFRMWSFYWKIRSQLGCPTSYCWWWRGWIWQLSLAGKLQSHYSNFSLHVYQLCHDQLLSLGIHPYWVQSVWWISCQPLPRSYSRTLCCKVNIFCCLILLHHHHFGLLLRMINDYSTNKVFGPNPFIPLSYMFQHCRAICSET